MVSLLKSMHFDCMPKALRSYLVLFIYLLCQRVFLKTTQLGVVCVCVCRPIYLGERGRSIAEV